VGEASQFEFEFHSLALPGSAGGRGGGGEGGGGAGGLLR